MNHPLTDVLTRDGIVLLPDLLSPAQLHGMQQAFEARLRQMRWNNIDGYEKTDLYQEGVQDLLTLDQGFVDVALHPLVQQICREYIGATFQLTEAKGWRSLVTNVHFNGWHGDAWYDQTQVHEIPRELKLAIYLTDVRNDAGSGAFNYAKGTHRKQAPKLLRAEEVAAIPKSLIGEVTGPAGTAFLFDTSMLHRQRLPITSPRQAVFYAYHDPEVPLQQGDRVYNRYHPLLLNAALLGNLSDEDRRILGFGDRRNYSPTHKRPSRHGALQTFTQFLLDMKLHADRLGDYSRRLYAKAKRTIGIGPG